MPISIPQSVFDKYYEVIDSTFDIFGVTCQLVSIEKREIITPYNPDDNLPDINSTKTIKEVEVLTDIKLKVYWDQKQWIRTANNLVIPDNSIQVIAFMTDLPKLLKAKALIVHKGIKDYKEQRFERNGEHIPIGLKQDRYVALFWNRV